MTIELTDAELLKTISQDYGSYGIFPFFDGNEVTDEEEEEETNPEVKYIPPLKFHVGWVDAERSCEPELPNVDDRGYFVIGYYDPTYLWIDKSSLEQLSSYFDDMGYNLVDDDVADIKIRYTSHDNKISGYANDFGGSTQYNFGSVIVDCSYDEHPDYGSPFFVIRCDEPGIYETWISLSYWDKKDVRIIEGYDGPQYMARSFTFAHSVRGPTFAVYDDI